MWYYRFARKNGSLESWEKFKLLCRETDKKICRSNRSNVRDVIGGSLKENDTYKTLLDFFENKDKRFLVCQP